MRIEDLPGMVADVLLNGTEEGHGELSAALLEIQQQLDQEEGAEGRFLGCLVSALEGGTPESALLEGSIHGFVAGVSGCAACTDG